MADVDRSKIAVNIWTARAVPVVLAGVVGYATYVVVILLCVNYLLVKHDDTAAAISILVVYFILFILMAVSFFRLVYITAFEPPYVPLGPAATRDRKRRKEKRDNVEDGIGSGEYNTEYRAEQAPIEQEGTGIDSPGLEMFYTKDVFVCEMDGKPKWCSTCSNWKPDRAHHCSSSGRCIMKMDHFCPWVGGPVGENNFKFFLQFTWYTALYCVHILVAMAIYIHQQRTTPGEKLSSEFIAILVLAAFFGLFTAGMTGTSIDLAVRNQTQVERLGAQTRIHILAVLKPSSVQHGRVDQLGDSGLSYPEITYPLDSGLPPPQDRWQPSHWMPISKVNTHTRRAENLSVSQTVQADQEQTTGMLSSRLLEPKPLSMPTLAPVSRPREQCESRVESLPPSRDLSSGSTVVTAAASMEPETETTIQANRWPNEEVAARDLKATRTFAVLKMLEPGDNPWDLGSALLNWENVMGTTVLDWFLPIRRSPCCNHDDAESYYLVGPTVDFLRERYNFIPTTEVRAGGRRRRSQRNLSPLRAEKVIRASHKDGHQGHKKKRRKHHSDKKQGSHESDPQIDLRDLNGHT